MCFGVYLHYTRVLTLTFSVFGLTAVADEGISGTGGTLRKDFFKEEYILNNAIGTLAITSGAFLQKHNPGTINFVLKTFEIYM
jgi:hypothetical protein